MVESDFPTLAFLNTHPGALKREISHEMACQPDEQGGYGDIEQHCAPLTEILYTQSIDQQEMSNNVLYRFKCVR